MDKSATEWAAIPVARDKKLVTGEMSNGARLLMVRKEDGEKVFRLPTHDEELDYISGDAW